MPLIFNGKFGGLSDSKFSGIRGSFYKCIGIDGHSEPGLLKVRQALEKESGTTVDELCRVRLAVSSGESFWFSYTSGKIWRRSSTGIWLLVHTTVSAAGGNGCLGAEEYDGFIYWATESRLHRIPIASIATAQNWTDNKVLNWATFTNTDSEWHPMVVRGLRLFIGDANFVAKVAENSGHEFTANALDLRTPFRIKTMVEYDIDLLIGTFVNDNVSKTELIRWDTYDTESWQTADTIEENGINAFIVDDNFIYVQAGKYGRIYFYDGVRLIPYKRIPGDWSPTKKAEIYPHAVSTLLTIPVFGLSNGAGNPAEQGVYSFGSYSKDYPKVLDLSYPVSIGLSSIEVGAVLVVGADLLVSWSKGSSYGVDKLNWSAKYKKAYIETMNLTEASVRDFLKTVSEFYANYSSLPDDTNIKFRFKKKNETSFSGVDGVEVINDTKLVQVRTKLGTIPDVANLQLRIDFIVKDNESPEIENIGYLDNVKRI